MDLVTQAIAEELDALRAAARAGAADADLIAAVAARVPAGDAGAWLREWTAAGGERWAAADHLPAASYYAAALGLVAATDDSVDTEALRARQRECWALAAERLGARPTRVGRLFPGGPGRRPVLVADTGSRPASSGWARAALAARARGWHWMAGEPPLAEVADALLERRDVDGSRLFVVGHDEAALSTARALASEHRFAAAVLDPGVHDVSSAWVHLLGPEAAAALQAGDREALGRELRLARLFQPGATALLEHRYDLRGSSRLEEEPQRISTPVFVCERPGERRWPGQARVLHARLRGPKALGAFAGALDWLVFRP